jgi:hypothetical protein
MIRVKLVNMPFSDVEIPSLALTQLQAMVTRRCGDRARVEICYASHDVCRYLGLEL